MKSIVIGNIEFEVELSVKSSIGVLHVMKSAKCLETGVVYTKEKANHYYRIYS